MLEKISSAAVAVLMSLIALAGVGALFYSNQAEALTTATTGTLLVTLNPNAGTESEFITLSFSGILGRPSYADLEGWRIANSSSTIFDLSEVTLHSSETVRICEEAATDPNCDYFYSGTDQFADNGDELYIFTDENVPVIYASYESSFPGAVIQNIDGSYTSEVYANKDKIAACQTTSTGAKAVTYSRQKALNSDKKEPQEFDVVPAFVYSDKKTLNYFPGVNWPEKKAFLQNNCQ